MGKIDACRQKDCMHYLRMAGKYVIMGVSYKRRADKMCIRDRLDTFTTGWSGRPDRKDRISRFQSAFGPDRTGVERPDQGSSEESLCKDGFEDYRWLNI